VSALPAADRAAARAELGRLHWLRFCEDPGHFGAAADLAAAAAHLTAVVEDPTGLDAEAGRGCLALLGIVLHTRCFQTYRDTGRPGTPAEFQAADRVLQAALDALDADDPVVPEVAFALGGLRVADHESRCGRPCPEPGGLAGPAALLSVAAQAEDAECGHLYVYAATLNKMYRHTHQPSDITRAVAATRRALEHPDLPMAERIGLRIDMAVQQASRGDALRRGGAGGRALGGSQERRESRDAFTAAAEQLQDVLATLDDERLPVAPEARRTLRLDARVELVEALFHRDGDRLSNADLDLIIRHGHVIRAQMAPDYPTRPFALGRFGLCLLQRVERGLGDRWDPAAEAVARSSDPGAFRRAFDAVPGLDADLASAVDLLTEALRLSDRADPLQPKLATGLGAAHAIRFFVNEPDGSEDDLHELGRAFRIVLEHPASTADLRRESSRTLMATLAHRLRVARTGPDTSAGALSTSAPYGATADSSTPFGTLHLTPTDEAAADSLTNLLARFVTEYGASETAELVPMLVYLTAARAGHGLGDEELAELFALHHDTAAAFSGQPVLQAPVVLHFAVLGAAWVRRGTCPRATVAEVESMFRRVVRDLPPRHPLTRYARSQADALTEYLRTRRRPGTTSEPGP
jgi:hypothetical protein